MKNSKIELAVIAVDDDPAILDLFERVLDSPQCPWKVNFTKISVIKEARNKSSFLDASIVFVDLNLGNPKFNGFHLLKKISTENPNLPVIVVSSDRSFDSIQTAIRSGAWDYIGKGFGREELYHVMNRVWSQKKSREVEENVILEKKQTLTKSGVLLGKSEGVQRVKELIRKFSQSKAPVLIEGETGTGKELVARALHLQSNDPLSAFVPVDCGSIPVSLADSFLFGHERGAFTGAEGLRKGVFESANGGVLFLDEINSLDLGLQSKLLRVLQESEIVRVGSIIPKSIDFRLISASNFPLKEMVARKDFRQDLFYRLNVVRIKIPPLRERAEDVVLLLENFMPNREFERDFISCLREYSWPGNVRELKNITQILKVLTDSHEKLTLAHLRQIGDQFFKNSQKVVAKEDIFRRFKNMVKEREGLEKKYFSNAYQECSGNVSRLAQKLGLDRSYLHQKLVRWDIHKAKLK